MSIALDQVTKRYQEQPVVNDVSIEMDEGEFFVLLGPSGSGKSTLLRAIAGLTGIDHGRISLHGRDVTHVRARDRGVGLVFQNYALFRHMTVADNIEFALRVRRMKRADRIARRKELLKLVALEGLDERLPGQLSGGQQQRVAVARALAHKPQVLLLDEPFGALDAKIREELRRTIRAVQRELGITTVLVTHDQEEAFAMADTIGVMNHGRLLEVGQPQDLYAQPATRFVATFLGAANLLLARQGADGIRFGATPVTAEGSERMHGSREHEVVAVLRPEEVEVATTREQLSSNYIARGAVEEIQFTGALERLRVRLLDEPSAAQLLGSGSAAEARVEVTRTQPERRDLPLRAGAQVVLGARRLHVLPTPISSFLACAPTEAEAAELAKEPLLESLSTRMKTRVGLRAIDGLTGVPEVFAGVAAISGGDSAAPTVEWL
ncbi:MAG TPA: ABC transporter ATP-binding protein, partial [Steroidobacteraceae bacterium]|nr:ABC transporter ATP-binding protein [Steroidobacteraceae bacterium]